MRNNKQLYQDLALSVFAQLDGMVVLMDLESRFVLSNKRTAHMFGFASEESMLGKNAFDINCPAVQYAEYFIKQDQEVRDSERTFEYLDIHTYHNNEAKILLTKKSPFYQNGVLAGTICQATEIREASLLKITSALIKSDQSYHTLAHDRSYILSQPSEKLELSDREIQCLFYLLRGFSMKQIGKKLSISDRTVETYLERIKLKRGLKNKAELVDYSLANGLVNYIPRPVLSGDFSVELG